MSIAPLKKLTLIGKRADKTATLSALQTLGRMHLVPLAEARAEPERAASRTAEDAYKALHFLAEVAGERRQIRRAPDFDIAAFVKTALDLRQKLREVGDHRDFLANRIAVLEPWGELVFPPQAALGGNLLWFYELPLKHASALEALPLPHEIVGRDTRTLYVALIAPQEPPANLLPVERVHIGAKPRSVLMEELEDAEIELEALRAERIALTRYLDVFRAHLSDAETQAELAYALEQTRDDDEVFVVQGWVPNAEIPDVERYAQDHGLALITEDPRWDETPPTLLQQPAQNAAGVSLAMFYQAPHYRGWDPTLTLVASFAVFFAMIVADAGYGLVLLAGLLAGWTRLNRSSTLRAWRRLGLLISAATITYGVLVGSYFGVGPPESSALARAAVLTLTDFDAMMRLSILIGVAHLSLALLMDAWVRRRRASALARLGWLAAIVGGCTYWLSGGVGPSSVAGIGLGVLGALAILGFTSERPLRRPLDGLLRAFDGVSALANAMGAFGDVLSYMRLFALGLASASLAITFNDLAGQVMDAVPGLGLLLGLLILAIGHVLNFVLALMSGVVHGLRLNYIEFFKWGLPDEGAPFRPLTRKEVQG